MKKSLCVAVVCLAATYAQAQTRMNCCSPSATDLFAMNVTDNAFILSHAEPLPFTYATERGKDISYKAADGTDAHAFEIKAVNATPYYLFVIHEWWGLNDYIKQEAEKLSNELGINVIALDLYDQKVASTREDAGKFMQSVKSERATAIIKGAFSYVGSDAKIFTIGWCFGGGWSLQTAIEGGKQVQGCIMYYGQPEKNINRLKSLNCDVIGFFATKDQWINPKMVAEFEADMQIAGKKVTLTEYEADHAFANPSNPNFDKTSTADAHAKEIAFIKARMK